MEVGLTMFNLIKQFYPSIFTIENVGQAVVVGWITTEEYQNITGEIYVAATN